MPRAKRTPSTPSTDYADGDRCKKTTTKDNQFKSPSPASGRGEYSLFSYLYLYSSVNWNKQLIPAKFIRSPSVNGHGWFGRRLLSPTCTDSLFPPPHQPILVVLKPQFGLHAIIFLGIYTQARANPTADEDPLREVDAGSDGVSFLCRENFA